MSLVVASGRCGDISYVIVSENDDTIKAEVWMRHKKEEKVVSSWKQAETWIGDILKAENYDYILQE